MQYVKPKQILLKTHSQFNETWVLDRLAEDPAILGLGRELVLKDRERQQPATGRLDLLFQDMESNRRYEVEVQLGSIDESHIIRAIEYWDIERKRYPQYDHCAVIVAEDITSRFLNVVSLFNGFIPLIAIQMTAFQVDDKICLLFTTVMDELRLGLDEDEEVAAVTDRAYWETRATPQTVAMADQLLEIVRAFDPELELKYNKYYIGIAKNNQPNNFAIFRPRKKSLRLEVRLNPSEEIEQTLDQAGIDVMDYDKRWSRYRVRLTEDDVDKHRELLTKFLRPAYDRAARQ